MSALLALLAFITAAVAIVMVQSLANGMNQIRVQLSRLERKKGLAPSMKWAVTYKPTQGRGKPTTLLLTASDEGDALRQIMQKKIDLSRIVSLEPHVPGDE